MYDGDFFPAYDNSALKSGRGPCPVTGTKKRWSYKGSPASPSFVVTYTHAPPLAGWQPVGKASHGFPMYVPKGHTSSEQASLPLAIPEPSSKTPEAATLHRRDLVYQTLFRHCPLSEGHRNTLLARGFTAEQIPTLLQTLRLASMPSAKQRPHIAEEIRQELSLSVEEMLTIPGFFINKKQHLSLAGREGLIFPSPDPQGRIQAFQIRNPRRLLKKGEARYTWCSGAGRGGISSGSPASFFGDPHAKEALLCEGNLKCFSVLEQNIAQATLSIAGVSNLRSIETMLEQLPQLQRLFLAYDMDWLNNPDVLRALGNMIQMLLARGLHVEVLGWDPDHGKGIDDALQGGMSVERLHTYALRDILRAATEAQIGSSKVDTTPPPVYTPPKLKPKSLLELRKETKKTIQDAFAKPPGSLVCVGANTGSGKTYCSANFAPARALYVYKDYKSLEEAKQELIAAHGEEEVGVLYGRAKAGCPHFAKAGCPFHEQMTERAERGHGACKGCPLAPNPHDPDKEICDYWKHTFAIRDKPPTYLLMVKQTFSSSSLVASLLPSEDTLDLLGLYRTLTVDDCMDLPSQLAHTRSLTPYDLETWLAHPSYCESNPDDQRLHAFLLALLAWCDPTLRPQIDFKQLQQEASVLCKQESFYCEQPTEAEPLPLKMLRPLLTWLAQGGSLYLVEDSSDQEEKGNHHKTKSIRFLQPNMDLLSRLKHTTLVYLDATYDKLLWAWFAQLLGMRLDCPTMKRTLSRLIQVVDILWDRQQVEQHRELITALLEKLHQEGGKVLGFKQIEPNNEQVEQELTFAFDGHWGRDERSTNAMTGATAMALVGHYALPTEELRELVWRLRSLSDFMGKRRPDVYIPPALETERRYHDAFRPWKRTMHCDPDPLVEHLRRHLHTSAVIQGANRSRNLEAPVYLLDGEPLDGLPEEIPVEVWTRNELIQELNLPVEKQVKKRTLSQALMKANKQKAIEQAKRLEQALPQARALMQEKGTLPSLASLQRLLSEEGCQRANQNFAKEVQKRLRQEELSCVKKLPKKKKENQEKTISYASECTDTHSHLNRYLERPVSVSLKSEAQRHDAKREFLYERGKPFGDEQGLCVSERDDPTTIQRTIVTQKDLTFKASLSALFEQACQQMSRLAAWVALGDWLEQTFPDRKREDLSRLLREFTLSEPASFSDSS